MRMLRETGLDDDDAGMYVAALSEPGALTAALNWYRAMDRDGAGEPRAGEGADALRLVDGDGAFGRDGGGGDLGTHVRRRTTSRCSKGVSHWVPETGARELSDAAGPAPDRDLTSSRVPISRGRLCDNMPVSDSIPNFDLTDVQRDFRADPARLLPRRRWRRTRRRWTATRSSRGSRSRPAGRWSCRRSGSPRPTGAPAPTSVTQAIAVEELARGLRLDALTILISKLGMIPVMNWASEELKQTYLPRVATGRSRPATACPRPTPAATWPP